MESFWINIYSKVVFMDDIRKVCSLNVLDGAKISVQAIRCWVIFYATALKTLKRDFGDKFLISYLRIKNLFCQPQTKDNDRKSLRQFHHQIQTLNACHISIRYKRTIF